MSLEDDLRAAGERLRQRQAAAKAELEAERRVREYLRDQRAAEFWRQVRGTVDAKLTSIENWKRRKGA